MQMKRTFLSVALSSILLLAACVQGPNSVDSKSEESETISESVDRPIENIDVANKEHIRPIGRTLVENGTLYFAYSESGFSLEAENESEDFSVSLEMTSSIASPYTEQYVNVYMDGVFAMKKAIPTGTSTLSIELNGTIGRHRIEVKKANEGQFSSLRLSSVSLGGAKAYRIEGEKKKEIEFFGDSITCAYGVLAESNREGFSMATEDSRFSYASIAAEIIGYEASLVSYSGIAIAISPFVSNGYSMMDVYDTVDGKKAYDIAEDPADVFVINLGTNDNTKYNMLPETDRPAGKALFVEHYIALIRAMLAINPDAPVVICYNMMTSLHKDLIYGIDEVWRNINADFPSQITALVFDGDNLGADGHPGKDAHQENGERLAEHLASIVGVEVE